MVQYKIPKKEILFLKYIPTYLQSPVDFIKVQPKNEGRILSRVLVLIWILINLKFSRPPLVSLVTDHTYLFSSTTYYSHFWTLNDSQNYQKFHAFLPSERTKIGDSSLCGNSLCGVCYLWRFGKPRLLLICELINLIEESRYLVLMSMKPQESRSFAQVDPPWNISNKVARWYR